MPCALVHPYVPDQNVPWAAVDLDDHRLSFKGDFAAPKLNTEMRRFTFRDAGSTLVGIGYILITLARLFRFATTDDDVAPFLVAVAYLLAALCLIGGAIDIWAHFCASQLRYTTSAVRVIAIIILAATSTFGAVINVADDITQCGDRNAIFSNDTNVSASAIAERQQYCIDVIEPYTAGTYVPIVIIFHLYPQHGMPMILLAFAMQMAGYAFAPSEEEERYTLRPENVFVSALLHLVIMVGAMILNYHVHVANRSRFVAAARAERARQLAMGELDEIDGLLKATLPMSVLERVTAHVEVFDDTDHATVLIGSLADFSTWSAEALAPTNAAVMLNTIVTAFDDVLSHEPGVMKVKTIGDTYLAVAGLPDPVGCHASVMCRVALELQDAAIDIANRRPDWGSNLLQVGVASGFARATILGTQRLCYEPYGDAVDRCHLAHRHGLIGRVCINESTRALLLEDTDAFGHDAAEYGLIFSCVSEIESQVTSHAEVALSVAGGVATAAAAESLYLLPMRNMQAQTKTRSRRRLVNPLDGTQTTASFSQAPSSTAEFSSSHRSSAERVGEKKTPRATDDAFELEVVEDAPDDPVVQLMDDADNARVADETEGLVAQQRLVLERRIAFVRDRARRQQQRAQQRANQAERRGIANVASGAIRYRHVESSLSPAEAETAEENAPNGTGLALESPRPTPAQDDDDSIALDPSMPTYESMTSAETNGIFAPASGMPFVYTFANDDAERSFEHFARKATYAMRRDCRVIMSILLGCMFVALFIDTATPVGVAAPIVIAFGLLMSVFNTVAIVRDIGPVGLDSVLAYACASLFLLGGFLADGNTIGNDVSWIPRVPALFVMLTIWTLSPPIRSAIHFVFCIAALLKLYILDVGAAQAHGVQSIASAFLMLFVTASLESFTRRAFVERFLAERLARQELAAKHAQLAMLENVVPRHAIPGLSTWMAAKFDATTTVATEFDMLVVAAMTVTRNASSAKGGVLDTHRVMDALLDRCLFVEKSKTFGDWVLFVGPFGAARTEHPDGELGAASVAICETLFVLKTLCQLGRVQVTCAIHVGRAIAAVLGKDRPSFDVWGEAPTTAERVLAALPSHPPTPEATDEAQRKRERLAAVGVRDVVQLADAHHHVALTEAAVSTLRETCEYDRDTDTFRALMPVTSKQQHQQLEEEPDASTVTYASGGTFGSASGSEEMATARLGLRQKVVAIKASRDVNTGARDRDIAVRFVDGMATEASSDSANNSS